VISSSSSEIPARRDFDFPFLHFTHSFDTISHIDQKASRGTGNQ
jgi:hypothetical protein